MSFMVKVERHKTHPRHIKAKFPPLMPDRNGSHHANVNALDQQSKNLQEFGNSGRALRLEDDGMRLAKHANKLKAAIDSIDERTKQVQQGIARARRLRSNFGGQAASATARRREMAQVNLLEGNLSMWTVRNNEQEAINNECREKINQLRIQLTAMKRVFNEHASDLKRFDTEKKELFEQANQIETRRRQIKAQIEDILKSHEKSDAEISRQMEMANSYIEKQKEKAMGRIDEVLNMVPVKVSSKNVNLSKNTDSEDLNKEGAGKVTEKKSWAPPKPVNESDYIEVQSEEEFEEAFAILGKATGSNDPLEIARNFISIEEDMFEIFRETERIHDKVRIQRVDVKVLKEKSSELHSKQLEMNAASAKRRKAMEDRIEKIRNKDRYQVERMAKLKRKFRKIADALSECFTSIGCDDMDQPSGIGVRANVGVTSASMRQYLGLEVVESNIMKYLGVIETKAVDVVERYKQVLIRDGADASIFSQFTRGPVRPHGGVLDRMKINAPKMDIQFYTHDRSADVKKNESALERIAGPVSPVFREEVMEELKSREDVGKTKFKRKKQVKLTAKA